MSYSFSEKLRTQIASRANWRCEYCLLGESDSFFSFQIDHIIAVKHSGSNRLENLAFACPQCNQHKGSDLATYQESTGSIIPLFTRGKIIGMGTLESIWGRYMGKLKWA